MEPMDGHALATLAQFYYPVEVDAKELYPEYKDQVWLVKTNQEYLCYGENANKISKIMGAVPFTYKDNYYRKMVPFLVVPFDRVEEILSSLVDKDGDGIVLCKYLHGKGYEVFPVEPAFAQMSLF